MHFKITSFNIYLRFIQLYELLFYTYYKLFSTLEYFDNFALFPTAPVVKRGDVIKPKNSLAMVAEKPCKRLLRTVSCNLSSSFMNMFISHSIQFQPNSKYKSCYACFLPYLQCGKWIKAPAIPHIIHRSS